MTVEHSKKGVKGFQKIPAEQQKTSVYNYRMTKVEYNTINNHCKSKGITKAEMFRIALNDYYKANNINNSGTTDENPNQLRID